MQKQREQNFTKLSFNIQQIAIKVKKILDFFVMP